MKTIFYLPSCSTCQRILKSLPNLDEFELRDIKSEAITDQEIKAMHKLAGSYEALFSRRAMKYKSMGLKDMELGEDNYRQYILSEYTFLKRPVVILDQQIFIGSAKKNIEALIQAIG